PPPQPIRCEVGDADEPGNRKVDDSEPLAAEQRAPGDRRFDHSQRLPAELQAPGLHPVGELRAELTEELPTRSRARWQRVGQARRRGWSAEQCPGQAAS
ncbi:unnamed protein product, partial [Symbiodinium sp. CCMP2456]